MFLLGDLYGICIFRASEPDRIIDSQQTLFPPKIHDLLFKLHVSFVNTLYNEKNV